MLKIYELLLWSPGYREQLPFSPHRIIYAAKSWRGFWKQADFISDAMTCGFEWESGDLEGLQEKNSKRSKSQRLHEDQLWELARKKCWQKIRALARKGERFMVGLGSDGDGATSGYDEWDIQVIVHTTSQKVIQNLRKMNILGFPD